MDLLTHNLNFKISSGSVSLGISSHASVSSLVTLSLDIFDNQSSIGENRLSAINWENSVVLFPDYGVNWISSNGTSDDESFSSDYLSFVHCTNVGEAVDVKSTGVGGTTDFGNCCTPE